MQSNSAKLPRLLVGHRQYSQEIDERMETDWRDHQQARKAKVHAENEERYSGFDPVTLVRSIMS
jgi:hypothetical protein